MSRNSIYTNVVFVSVVAFLFVSVNGGGQFLDNAPTSGSSTDLSNSGVISDPSIQSTITLPKAAIDNLSQGTPHYEAYTGPPKNIQGYFLQQTTTIYPPEPSNRAKEFVLEHLKNHILRQTGHTELLPENLTNPENNDYNEIDQKLSELKEERIELKNQVSEEVKKVSKGETEEIRQEAAGRLRNARAQLRTVLNNIDNLRQQKREGQANLK